MKKYIWIILLVITMSFPMKAMAVSGECFCSTSNSSDCKTMRNPRGEYTVSSDMSKCVDLGSTDELNFCVTTSSIWQYVGYGVVVVKIVIPLVIIILGVIELAKAVTSNDDKAINKSAGSIVKRLIAGVIIFFIPTVVHVIFSGVKNASSYISQGEICEECLLKPNSNKCTYAKEVAKKEIAAREAETNKKVEDPEESVCYYCNTDGTKEYVWTTEKKETCLEMRFNQASCTEANEKAKESNARALEAAKLGESSSGVEPSSEITTINLNNLSCSVYYGNSKLTSLKINSAIKDSMQKALENTCKYLKSNKNRYGVDYIMTAGTYVPGATNPAYPHAYAMGIDLFNGWSYKGYNPYGDYSYGAYSSYRRFVCDVCGGNEACDANLMYQIYNKFFKPLGYCWGGNWGPKYFDPMHIEMRNGSESCSTLNKQRITC